MSDEYSVRIEYGEAYYPVEGDSPDDSVAGECIICRGAATIVFTHRPVQRRRVAAPERVGLCRTCEKLVRADDFALLAERADEQTWGDFEATDLHDTAQDFARDLTE